MGSTERQEERWTATEWNEDRGLVEFRVGDRDGNFVAFITVKVGDKATVARMVAAAEMEARLQRIHLLRVEDDDAICACGECSQCEARAALEAAKRLQP